MQNFEYSHARGRSRSTWRRAGRTWRGRRRADRRASTRRTCTYRSRTWPDPPASTADAVAAAGGRRWGPRRPQVAGAAAGPPPTTAGRRRSSGSGRCSCWTSLSPAGSRRACGRRRPPGPRRPWPPWPPCCCWRPCRRRRAPRFSGSAAPPSPRTQAPQTLSASVVESAILEFLFETICVNSGFYQSNLKNICFQIKPSHK